MRHPSVGVLVAAAGIVAAASVWLPAVEASSIDEASRASIVVRTYTQPDSADAIGTARRIAGAVLGRAGVAVTWIECGLPGEAADASMVCRRPLRWNELSVRILRAGTVDRGHQVTTLGYALVDLAAGSGSLATVYADRVELMAHGAGVDAAELLGKAMAHEIGHLLLGSNRHGSRGLMRASWSGTDLRRSVPEQWLFDGREGDVMRRGIASRLRADDAVPAE